jgi:hypothetical protein
MKENTRLLPAQDSARLAAGPGSSPTPASDNSQGPTPVTSPPAARRAAGSASRATVSAGLAGAPGQFRHTPSTGARRDHVRRNPPGRVRGLGSRVRSRAEGPRGQRGGVALLLRFAAGWALDGERMHARRAASQAGARPASGRSAGHPPISQDSGPRRASHSALPTAASYPADRCSLLPAALPAAACRPASMASPPARGGRRRTRARGAGRRGSVRSRGA